MRGVGLASKVADVDVANSSTAARSVRLRGLRAAPDEAPANGALPDRGVTTVRVRFRQLELMAYRLAVPELIGAAGAIYLVWVVLLLQRSPKEPGPATYWGALLAVAAVAFGFGALLRRGVARLYRRSERARRRLMAVIKADEEISTTLDLAEVLNRICRLAVESLDLKMAWIGFTEPGSYLVKPVASFGAETGYLAAIRVTWDDEPSGQGPMGVAIKTGQPAIVTDTATDPSFSPWREEALQRGYRSVAALPLRFADTILGSLGLYAARRNAFGEDDRPILQAFANQAAIAMEHARLFSEITKRDKALESTNRKLRQLSAFQQELTHMMVHDLKNPLGAIMGGLELVLSGDLGHTDQSVREVLEDALGASKTLMKMIVQMLDINRLEEGAMEVQRQRVGLKAVVDDVLKELSGFAVRNAVALESAVRDQRLAACGDPDLLRRVVANLVTNAIKFSPRGGTVTLEASPGDVGQVVVSVRDHGPGVPDSQKARIFDKFAQVDGPGRRPPGTGLGLTFCRLAVEAHGGRVWVEDAPGGGSLFKFTVPAWTPPCPEPAKEPPT